MTAPRGSGSIRQRRPGVWEIRVAAGTDPVTGRTLSRSVTFRGSEPDAHAYREELAAEYVARRSVAKAAPKLTLAELLYVPFTAMTTLDGKPCPPISMSS
jgi:hypothetical protein